MKFRWILSGTLIAFIITAALIFVTAAVEYFTGLSENAAGICVYAATAVSVFCGAAFSAGKAGTKALFNAMAVSVIYIAAVIIISLVINGRINTDMHCASVIMGALLAGFLGAVCVKK